MEVKLQTKLTLFAPFKKRHTRTLVLHRTSMSSDSVDNLLAAMESRGWTTRSSPSSPSPAMVRSCRSCGCQKFRQEFSRHQCRKPSLCCLNCATGERIVIAVEKKRRLTRVKEEAINDFVPPPPKPVFVPPAPHFKKFVLITDKVKVNRQPGFQGQLEGFLDSGQVVTEYERSVRYPAWIRISAAHEHCLWIVCHHEDKRILDPVPAGPAESAWDSMVVAEYWEKHPEMFGLPW